MSEALATNMYHPQLSKLSCSGDWQNLASNASLVLFNPWGGSVPSGQAQGSLVFVALQAYGDSDLMCMASRRLTLEAFRSAVLEQVCKKLWESPVEILKFALVETHKRVRSFSREMMVQGRIRADVLALAVRHGHAVSARVGVGEVFLLRNTRSFPFFAAHQEREVTASVGIGGDEALNAEIMSVKLESEDVLSLSGSPFSLGEAPLLQVTVGPPAHWLL